MPRRRHCVLLEPSAAASAYRRALAPACARRAIIALRVRQAQRQSSGERSRGGAPSNARPSRHRARSPLCCSPMGSYCVAGSGSATLCPAGTYGSTTGLTTSACSGVCACCSAGATALIAGSCSQTATMTSTGTPSPFPMTTVGATGRTCVACCLYSPASWPAPCPALPSAAHACSRRRVEHRDLWEQLPGAAVLHVSGSGGIFRVSLTRCVLLVLLLLRTAATQSAPGTSTERRPCPATRSQTYT